MTELPPLSVTRLHEVVVDALESRILSGECPAGTLLPPEARLAEQLQVGRRAVREALRALQAKGLVEIRMGVGMRVVRNDLDGFLDSLVENISGYLSAKRAELDHIFELRGIIERYAAGRLASSRDAEALQELEGAVERQRQARRKRDGKLYFRHHIAFHTAIVERLGNPIITMVYGQLLRMTQRRMLETGSDLTIMAKAIDEHAELLALVGRGPTEAEVSAAVDAHLSAAKARFR